MCHHTQLQFFPIMRTFKMFSLNSFRICNTVLLTLVTTLSIPSPSHLFSTWSLYLLVLFTHFIHPPPTSPTFVLYTYDLFKKIPYLNDTIRHLFVFLCLTYFNQHNALKIHPCCHNWQDFVICNGRVRLYCIQVPCFLYPLIHRWTLTLYPHFGCCK